MGLQWQDVDFQSLRINVTRSIVKQRLGRCKTEPSLAAVPLPRASCGGAVQLARLRSLLSAIRLRVRQERGRSQNALWGSSYHAKKIMPIARKLGMTRLRGWHTFRHTYGSLLHEKEARLKVVQELMRHKTIRTSLDTHIQALTPSKRKAQKSGCEGPPLVRVNQHENDAAGSCRGCGVRQC